ncbi:sensor histidine kinase [Fusibacter bizertensis]
MIYKYLTDKRKMGYKLILMSLLILLASIIGAVFKIMGFPETNIVIVYLLTVLVYARLMDGIAIGIIASIVATLAFNYFFTEPYFTLSVLDSSYFITFVIMTITSIITSTMTSLVKKSELIAREKEAETNTLFKLTNQLTDANDIHVIASIVADALTDCFSTKGAILCFDEDGNPENTYIQRNSAGEQVRRKVEEVNTLKIKIEKLHASFYEGDEFYDWPIYGRESILGIVRIPTAEAQQLDEIQIRLLHSMIESTALAMDRTRVSEQRIREREESIQERYRGALLRSISHDLRTPLAGIMGTSEMLLDMTETVDQRYDLIDNIYNDAKWLHSLVENILCLTRLQEGKLVLKKQPEVVEEIVGSAVDRFLLRAKGREVKVKVPDDAFSVYMDAKLIEQVILNLLDNAHKFSSIDNEIGVFVELLESDKIVRFTIQDSGIGISDLDLPYVLEQFYTGKNEIGNMKSGMGLGLSICDAIIRAHDGTITIENRKDSTGLDVIFTLPLEVQIDA